MNDPMIPCTKDEHGEEWCYMNWRGNLEIALLSLLVIAAGAFVLSPLYMPQYVSWTQVIAVTAVGLLLAALKDTVNPKAVKRFLETV